VTDQQSSYAAEVECAIGLNVGGGAEGVYAARDAVLAVRDREMEQLRAELGRVQQAACRTAEALRLNSKRLDAVLADRESERAARTAEEKRARAAEAVLARVRQMADHWEKQLPDVIRTPAVVSALRAALDRAELPEATEFR
jgi:septal ring factor EnvC (AmiA/AmiB activator)